MRLPAAALPRLTASLALAATLACNEDFTPQYRVTDLRILSIRSEAPPGSFYADALPQDGTVRLRALVVNPKHRAPVRYTWTACLPLDADAASGTCLDPAYLRDPEKLATAPGAVPLADGEDLGVLDVALPDASAALAAIAARAETEPGYACRPYVEVPVVLAIEAGGVRQVAVKVVRIAGTDDPTLYVRNTNTAVHEFRLRPTVDQGCDGLLLAAACDSDAQCSGGPCLPGADGERGRCANPEAQLPASGTFDVCAWPDWSRIQRYDVCDPNGTRSSAHEVPSWQWYVSAGDIDQTNAVGNATGERITITRPSGPFTIWIVLHDGRGGEGWMRYDAP